MTWKSQKIDGIWHEISYSFKSLLEKTLFAPVDGAIYILIPLNLGPHVIQLRVPQFVN